MPLLEGTAAGSMGPADLEEMGFQVVAVDLIELAVSPGLAVVAAAGGLGAYTAWGGAILALTRGQPAAAIGPGKGMGWRARGRPVLVREQGDELTLRSPIDGSTHHLTSSGLARAALDLGATPVTKVLGGGRVAWWEEPDTPPPPSAGLVVSAVPAIAARAGRYWTAEGWLEIAAQIDAAVPGPLVAGCACRTCEIAAIGYIKHLWHQREITAMHLLGWHNLHQARLLVEG